MDMGSDIVHQDVYFYDVPSISLLLICKKVRGEAELLFYEKNTFVMPTSRPTARFFALSMLTPIRQSSLKSVEVDLDPSDLDLHDKSIICSSRSGSNTQSEHVVGLKYEYAQRISLSSPLRPGAARGS